MVEKPKREWLILLPDKPDSLTRRLKVRLEHLSSVHELHDAGFWAMSGAYMSPTLKDTGIVPMIGSAMIALANTKEDILAVLERDVYAREGVWDLERVQIWPFRSTVRAKL